MSGAPELAASERLESVNVEETRALGRELAGRLPADGVLLLFGELGSGKTALTQGIAQALGIDPESVQSPSYTLINEHDGAARKLIHIDLYRLTAQDLAALGLEELLHGPGLKVVEWAERIDFPVAGAWRLRLTVVGRQDQRTFVLEAGAPASMRRDTNDGGLSE